MAAGAASLRVLFGESGAAKYQAGLGAHHAEYVFQPVDEPSNAAASVHGLERAVDDASRAVSKWQRNVKEAAIDALKAGKAPIDAGLAAACA